MEFKQCSVSTNRSKVCQVNIPHIIRSTTSLNRSYKEGWIHAFMLYMPNSGPTIWTSQQKLWVIRPSNVLLLFSNFNVSVWIVALVFCSWVTGVAPGVAFCCCRFDMLYIQKSSSAYTGCNHYLSTVNSLAIVLWYQQGTFIAHWIFSPFRSFCVNDRDGLCG